MGASKLTRVVLDTNIFLSALISPHGCTNQIYTAWRSAKFDILTSNNQLDELKRASRYPKFKAILQPALVGTMVNYLQHAIILDPPIQQDFDIRDPNDAFLIALSTAGQADYLVTGDHRSGLLEKRKIGRTRIMIPAVFCSDVL